MGNSMWTIEKMKIKRRKNIVNNSSLAQSTTCMLAQRLAYTLGQPVGTNMLSLLRWPYVEPTRWPYVGPMSKITLGQRLFYDVGPTCTYNHGQTLAQHRAYTLAYGWANMMALRRTNTLALRRADEQNYIGPTPFLWCWANVHVQPWANVSPT